MKRYVTHTMVGLDGAALAAASFIRIVFKGLVLEKKSVCCFKHSCVVFRMGSVFFSKRQGTDTQVDVYNFNDNFCCITTQEQVLELSLIHI